MNTCFLLTHIPDPKTNKRIKILKDYGSVSIICIRRKKQDIWELLFNDVKYYICNLDLPTSQHIFKRGLASLKYQKAAMKKLKKINPDVIYADGLDSLMIAAKYKKIKKIRLFYDVADLREIYIEKPEHFIKKIICDVIKAVEKYCFRNVDFLVITSPKFYSKYYYRLIRKEKVIYMPNAPERKIFDHYKKKNDGDFTVGFIGGIRYLEQMIMLVDVAEKCGYKVLFAGAGGTDENFRMISEYCEGKDFVSFTGKYDYERDVAGLYGKVDCVYAVYDADNPNVRIALPNKLYESVLCELPIITAKHTYLSEIVEAWGVGLSVGHKSKLELEKALRLLSEDQVFVYEIQKNCRRMKKAVIIEKYEKKLRKIVTAISN